MGIKSAYETGRIIAREEIELGHYTDRQDMLQKANGFLNRYKTEKARADFVRGLGDWIDICLKNGWVTEPHTSDIPEQVYPQEADALVKQLGYAQQVEDYEYNDEIGHVYSLKNGSALVVTCSLNGSYVHYLVAETNREQADALVELVGLTDQVKDYEENERGHVYFLVNSWSLVVTSPTSCLIDNGEGQISYHNIRATRV